MQNYLKLESIFKKASALNKALGVLHWDNAVMMPSGSTDSRAEQTATIESVADEIITSREALDLMSEVQTSKLDEWQQANFHEMIRLKDHILAVPADLKAAYSKSAMKCEMIWRQARQEDDFKKLIPSFKEVLKLAREVAKHKSGYFGYSLYDSCLDTYEPGTREQEINSLFATLEGFLPNLIQEAVEHQRAKAPKIASGTLFLEKSKQRKIGIKLMKAFGFDFNRGRLDTSAHPFCGGNSEDVRITTRYDEHNFVTGILGVMHETGHALYEQNLPKHWCDQPVGMAMGMATHESQSLIMEKQVCKSKEFLKFLITLIQKEITEQRPELEANNFYKIVNSVRPSFIRVDADELTYPVHILIRYKLEKAMINSELSIEDLPAAWNDLMHQMLGIKPDSNRTGCMQDIHWPGGMFGYFPSYTMGAIMAAQLFATLKAQMPNIMEQISQGKFIAITEWLKKAIHNCGKKHCASDLLSCATGKRLDVENYKSYLYKKFITDY